MTLYKLSVDSRSIKPALIDIVICVLNVLDLAVDITPDNKPSYYQHYSRVACVWIVGIVKQKYPAQNAGYIVG